MHQPDALGNGRFVDEIQWVQNANEERSALDHFDPAQTAVVDRRFAALFDGKAISADTTAQVRLTSYHPEELCYTVTSQKGGIVVFSEIYYPHGWKATVDGIETPKASAHYVLKANYVPAGTHRVVMSIMLASTPLIASIASRTIRPLVLQLHL